MRMLFFAANQLALKIIQLELFARLCCDLGVLVEAVALIIRVLSPDNNGDLGRIANRPHSFITGSLERHGLFRINFGFAILRPTGKGVTRFLGGSNVSDRSTITGIDRLRSRRQD